VDKTLLKLFLNKKI